MWFDDVACSLQVASWSQQVGVASAVKWAPRRVMFATASLILSLWIPDLSKLAAS